MNSDIPFYRLKLTTFVWNKDSHGLFDYHNDKLYEKQFEILGNAFVYADTKSQDDITIEPVVPCDNPRNIDSVKLLSVGYKAGTYWVYHANDLKVLEVLKNPAEQAWIPIKTMPRQSTNSEYFGYKLRQGEIIKFGRVRFRIKKISSNQESESSDNNVTFNSDHKTENKHENVADIESSQHSFGPSAMNEIKNEVNEFFNH